jgi:hypothetical protein
MWNGRIAFVLPEMESDIVVMETLPQGAGTR